MPFRPDQPDVIEIGTPDPLVVPVARQMWPHLLLLVVSKNSGAPAGIGVLVRILPVALNFR